MPAAYQEPLRPWNFVISQANGNLSRQSVTIVSGSGVVQPGTVLGRITASGKYKQYTVGASDGSQNAVAILGELVDATSADKTAGAIVRLAEVNTAALQWGATVTTQPHRDAAYTSLLTQYIANR